MQELGTKEVKTNERKQTIKQPPHLTIVTLIEGKKPFELLIGSPMKKYKESHPLIKLYLRKKTIHIQRVSDPDNNDPHSSIGISKSWLTSNNQRDQRPKKEKYGMINKSHDTFSEKQK